MSDRMCKFVMCIVLAGAVSAAHGGTVAYWEFDSSSSSAGLTDSVNSYDFSVVSGTFTASTTAATNPVPNPDTTGSFSGDAAANPDAGVDNASLLCPGSGGTERLTVSSDPGTVFNLSGKDFTFEGWFQHGTTAASGWADVIGGTRIGTAGWGGWFVGVKGDGNLMVYVDDRVSPVLSFTTSGYNYNDNAWHHFALVWQDGEGANVNGRMSLYIDGTLAASGDASATFDAAAADSDDSTFSIAGRNASGCTWDGRFDEFRFSDSALSPSQFLNASSGPDETAPVFLSASSTPADDATGVETNQSLVAVFDEDIFLTGNGTITISNETAGTEFASYDLSTSPAQVSASGTELTINPDSDFDASTAYSVQISGDALTNAVGLTFAGIADRTTWNFETLVPAVPETIPGLVAWYRADNIVDGDEPTGGTLTGWFDSSGNGGNLSGGAPAYVSSSAAFGNMPVVSFDGSDDALTSSLAVAGQTVIVLADFSEMDNWRTLTSGDSDFTFNLQKAGTDTWRTGMSVPVDIYKDSSTPHITTTTGNQEFSMALPSGPHVAAIAANASSTDEFQLGRERSGSYANGDIAEVLVYDNELTAEQINDIGYYLQEKYSLSTSFYDSSDPDPPVITVLSPTNNASEVGVFDSLVATFDEDIFTNTTGSVVLSNRTDHTITTIEIGDSSQITVSDNVLTIVPTDGLSNSTPYAVLIDDNALKDAADNFFAGIPQTTNWWFETAALDETAPTLDATDIIDDRSGASIVKDNAITYTLQFSEKMNLASFSGAISNAGSSSVTIGDITQDTPVDTNVYVVVTPTTAGTLQLQVSSNVTDLAGNPLGGDVTDDDTITVTDSKIYTWTGGGVANDIDDPDNWAQATAPASGSKIGTTDSTDIIRFDSETATLPTANIEIVRIGSANKLPYFELLNGSLNINRAENWGWGGTTFTIGDGNMTTLAQANFAGTINLNRDGGIKTYVVNADGTLKMDANFVFGQINTVIRLLGGTVDAAGRTVTANFTEIGSNYVSFESEDSTFTANYGGQLTDASTVEAQFGSSFRLGGDLASNPDAVLIVRESGTGFTVGVRIINQPTVFRFR